MKKVAGWLLIVFCSLILFFIGAAIVITFVEYIEGTLDPAMNIVQTIVGFMLPLALLYWGMKYGINLVKKKKIIDVPVYPGIIDIRFSGKIEFDAYRNLVFVSLFKRKIFIYFFIIVISFIILFIMKDIDKNSSQYYFVLLFMLLGILVPVVTFFQIKKQYETNAVFKEKMTYHITNDSIQILGETLNAIQKWPHFIKISETKNFFLFYQSNQIATLLDKKMFAAHELTEFRTFIQSLNIPGE